MELVRKQDLWKWLQIMSLLPVHYNCFPADTNFISLTGTDTLSGQEGLLIHPPFLLYSRLCRLSRYTKHATDWTTEELWSESREGQEIITSSNVTS